MDARETKAFQIAATLPIRRTKTAWIVPSQSRPGTTYRVTHPTLGHLDVADGLTCTCLDFDERQRPCKHIIAVGHAIHRDVGQASVDAMTPPVKVTYSQNWAAYNRAQCEEKERFIPMLADLCSTLSRPYSGRGRPRLPMSDMAFTSVMKVYEGLSARRLDSDVRACAARGLTAQDPHFNSVLRYLRSPEMTSALHSLVTLSALPLNGVETDFAVDSTGFTTSRFVRWYDHKWGKEMSKRQWVKLHAMCGVRTNIVTSVEMTDYRGADYNQLPGLVEHTAANFTLKDVTADKAYSGRSNLQAIADLGGTPYIPFPAHRLVGAVPAVQAVPMFTPEPQASAWVRMYHMFAYQRDTFLAHYHQRSNVETTFSMIKRKFGDSLRSKSDVGQMNEVLCKVVAHNLCVLIGAMREMDLPAPTFT